MNRSASTPPPRRLRTQVLAGAVAFALALSGLFAMQLSAAEDAEATPATGGSGRFIDAIDWVTWGTNGQALPNGGFSGSSTRVIGGVTVTTTCTASNLTSTQANQGASFLQAYRPGNYSGDGLDNLYNVGGADTANTLVNALANTVQGSLVAFDFNCAATANGSPVALAGLVVADAEQSTASQGEYVQAAPGPAATWRIIDRYRTPGCTASALASVNAQNVLRLSGAPTLCASGPMGVAFMEGVAGARVSLQGGGLSAIALGVVLASDFSDAPASYGEVAHIISPSFTGGAIPVGQQVAINNSTFTLGAARGSVWGLGTNADPETAPLYSATATGDDADGGGAFGPADDEDALTNASITGEIGEAYTATIACHNNAGLVAGWIDWNVDGDFADAGERSNTATCAGGSAAVTWTISSAAVGLVFGSPTFMRLRGAESAADLANPTGLAYSGEVEDHRVTLDLATTIEVVKDVESRADAADSFTVSIGSGSTVVASAATGPADTVTTQRRIVDAGVAYTVGETLSGNGFDQYLTPEISCSIGGQPAAVTGAAPSWALPPLIEGQQAVCTIVNEAIVPSIAFDKIAGELQDLDGDGPSVGDTIGYTFTLENTGNVDLTDVGVDDALIAVACGQDTLAIDESITCGPVTYELTQADLDAGQVVNTATASGTGPDGDAVTVDDSTTTLLEVRPTASDDVATAGAGLPTTVDILANDDPGSDADTLDPTSVVFTTAGQPAGATVAADGKTITVEGEGVYTIDPTTGAITFTPEVGFVGTAAPVQYSVANVDGRIDTASLTATVAPAPSASDDSASTPIDTAVEVDVLANDEAAPGRSLDATSVVFPDVGQPAGAEVSDDGRTLTVAGEGTYAIDASTGQVTFTPEAGFSGATQPVTYAVSDDLGAQVTAQLQIAVGPPPIAIADRVSTPFGAPTAPIDVLDNDVFDAEDAVDPASVVFPTDGQPEAAVVSADGKTLTIPDVGEFVVGDDGTVVFTPADGFSGTVPDITYSVSTESGATADSTISVTVGAAVDAVDDTATTPAGAAVTVPVVGNDSSDPQAPLDRTSVIFPTVGQPVGATVSEDGTTLTVPGEGTYVVDPATGAVTFTPVPTFTGTASPVTYQVADSNGLTDTATLTVTVGAPPTAVADTGRTQADTPVSVPVLGNDAADTGVELDATSVVFPTDGQPAGSTISDDGKTLTVEGEGVYVIDPTTGAVTFTPEDDFTGTATPVTYQVADENGATGTATLTITVADPVAAADDVVSTPFGQPTGPIDVLGNDTTGDDQPFDATSVVFPTEGQPEGSTVSDDGKTLTVEGEGVYVIDPTTGAVTFTPEDDFTGVATPVAYEVTNAENVTVGATLTVTVGAPPTALDDAAGTLPGVAVELDVTSNDASDPSTQIDVTSVAFPTEGQPAGSTVSDDGRTLTVPGEGSYAADPVTGVVTFTPEDGFEGVATPVTYQVADANGATTTAVIRVEVAMSPVLADDAVTTPYGTAITVPVLANDAGDGLVASSVVFPTGGQPAGATVSPDGKTLTVPGEGVYVVGADGSITFTPEATFSGSTTTPIVYQAADANGLTGTAQLTVAVGAGPVAETTPDTASGPAGQPVVIDVLGNDRPSPGASWDPASVVFPTTGQPTGATVSEDGRTLTVPGEGIYTIGADGRITFTPEDGFSGATTPITYQVTDTAGATVSGTVSVTVEAPAPSPSPSNPAPSTPPTSGGGLPQTGVEAGVTLAAIAGLLMLLGAAVALRNRRRLEH